ncbi:lysophospholipid acyltransferase family protein [Mesorhizobium marinum]|uniref:Lysophospholipid acyltransferase family protein n=1 Tax=Mesorhizobium marinum TaxID=3228790 RepID=A0ABV3R222_9HYPH
MDEQTATQPAVRRAAKDKNVSRPKALWVRIREPLAQSRVAKAVVTSLFAQALRFIRLTNPVVAGSARLAGAYEADEPGIIALWHGQHLLAPVFYPSKRRLVAMVSRSADAELNAMVVEKFGIEAVRGSGGRHDSRHLDKGGAKALIALKKSLDAGKNVAMIADIPHGKPRDAGMGIILLARLSGRPIIPAAIATSRRKVLEQSWDKTTISLPFGRSAVAVGDLVHVPKNADEAEMERIRQHLTDTLNAATEKAYALADGVR